MPTRPPSKPNWRNTRSSTAASSPNPGSPCPLQQMARGAADAAAPLVVPARLRVAAGLARGRGGDVVDGVLAGRLGRGGLVDLAGAGELRKDGYHNGFGVDVEVPAQGGAGVGHAEPVGAQRGVVARYPARDEVGHGAHPV